MELLVRIARCPIVALCLAQPEREHPCREIVLSQDTRSLEHHQVPEPWSGHLVRAPILFVSSNPSISSAEDYPVPTWDDSDLVDFFDNRFTGEFPRIKEGIYGRGRDGAYPRRGTAYWIGVRARAAELLGRPAVAGEDYALTEVVHCKSVEEIGVASATDTCADRYLDQVVGMSGARVVVGLGMVARSAAQRVFGLPQQATVSGPVLVGSLPRTFAFMPHPTSRAKTKKFSNCLAPEELRALRDALRA